MTKAASTHDPNPDTIARMPSWVTRAGAQTPEDVIFLSGAALATLHLVAASEDIPHALWRARLALSAAGVCVKMSGRREGAAALRDAVHLLRPGDHPGPAGAIFRQWTDAVARPVSVGQLAKVIGDMSTERIALCLDATDGHPVGRAAAVLQAVLACAPRAETAALILADAVMARALGWDHVLPLLSLALKPHDLRLRDDALRLACHLAVVAGAGQAVPLAADLARRAARLGAVAPKLRARGAARAVEMFLSRDALAPAALTGILPDRAARRLCDRLVDLGAVHELTGRETFRLYGV